MASRNQKSKAEIEVAREFAKNLFVQQGITDQKELAKRTNISVTSINKWINADEGLWKRLRESFLITKESELRRLYMQLTELNDHIMAREKGKRFANSKEGDALSKITKAIQQLETDSSLSETMEAMKNFLIFIRQMDLEFAKRVTVWADQFIKSKIK
ncbi:MAG: DDE transposase family protein [Bacteroidota bacterium]